jgi:hypothetical protein
MTDVPPPIPFDADLRHMPSYMIDVQSLLGSDLAAFGDPAANWYAVLTWCAALHQIPAGSLPDDDAILAWLVRLGRDVRTWKKFRAKGALRGWVKHSDGRLYHPVVTKKVMDLLHVSRAGKAGGLASGAVRAARRTGQASENINTGINDRSDSASSENEGSLKQNGNKGREGKGIERKEREEISALGQTAERKSRQPTLLDTVEVPAPTRKPRARARTSLDPAWVLPEESRQYARERGWSEREIDFQFEKFKNHHIAKGNLMADWSAAWRTWVGNGYGPRAPSPGGGAPPRSRADSTAEGILAGMEADERFDR